MKEQNYRMEYKQKKTEPNYISTLIAQPTYI